MIDKTYSYISDNIDEIYLALAEDLVNKGQDVNGTRELCNVQFTLTNPKNNIVRLAARKTSKKYLLAENLWYAAGHNEVSFIGKFASLWNKISDDGVTNNSAYGYIMKYKHSFDQIQKIVEMLSKTPDNRRAVIVINEPNENIIETKDEQCTMYLQFFIRDNKLNMTANMRSNDFISGLANDVVAFTALQMYIASLLNIDVGTYTHFDGSLHYYHNERDDAKMEAIINDKLTNLDEKYDIDWVKLYQDADMIYADVEHNTDKLMSICRKYGVLKDGR